MEITQINHKKIKKAGRVTTVIIVGLLSALFVVGFFYITLSMFNLETVRVVGSERYVERDIVDALNFSDKTNLFYLDSMKVKAMIEHEFPFVETAEVEKDFPHTLTVRVTETEAKFIFEGEDGCYTTSRKMKVLAKLPAMSDNYVFVAYNMAERQTPGESFKFNKSLDKTAFFAVVSALENTGLLNGATEIDFSDKFAVSVTYESRIRLEIGDYRNADGSLALCAQFVKTRTGDEHGTVFVSGGNLYYEPEN